MRQVNQILIDQCVEMNCCISQMGRNLIVEVPRDRCDDVVQILKSVFEDVVDIRKTYLMIAELHDFILVKPLISESPLSNCDGMVIPSAEKMIVDWISDKEFASTPVDKKRTMIQRYYEIYDINRSKLMRYAGRKGKKEEVDDALASLDQRRVEVVRSLQRILSEAPVSKAWLFGSFARCEERPDSDVDILVKFNSRIGLFAFSALINKIEAAIGLHVDLVAEGSLKPFAIESVEKDKVLIYERTTEKTTFP